MNKKISKKCVLRSKIRCQVGSIIFACLLIVGILQAFIYQLTNQLSEQFVSERWDKKDNEQVAYEQVTCFFENNSIVKREDIKRIHNQLEKILLEQGVKESDANNNSGENRNPIWIEAYSGMESIEIEGSYNNITALSLGVGGDFFFFHPETLKEGKYVIDVNSTETNEEENIILLNENSAWRLFGATNVTGLNVIIEGEIYKVVGVIANDERYLGKEAGIEDCMVYMPYVSWERIVENPSVDTYEILFPNLVNDFAKKCLESAISTYRGVEIVDNTNRFSLIKTGTQLLKFPEQYMDKSSSNIPYWENMARGYEGIAQLVLGFQVAVVLLVGGISFCMMKHRKML